MSPAHIAGENRRESDQHCFACHFEAGRRPQRFKFECPLAARMGSGARQISSSPATCPLRLLRAGRVQTACANNADLLQQYPVPGTV